MSASANPSLATASPASSAILEARGLCKAYAQGDHELQVLKSVDLEIRAGQFTSIMGPSGSGKSTMLHLLGGLDRPTSGSVWIGGQAIHAYSDDALSEFRRRKLGFIFQFFNLLPTLTALENVALPLLLDGKPMKQVRGRAEELLIRMGLRDRMEHRPDQLSGGQMQRVAIARALVTGPLLILADEPTGNLDTATGTAVLDLLSGLVREQGQTVVMVTHDPKAAAYADRRIFFRDGRIERDELSGPSNAERHAEPSTGMRIDSASTQPGKAPDRRAEPPAQSV